MEEEGAPTPTPLDKLERILNSGNTELVKEAFLRMDAAITRKNSQLMSLQAEVKELRDSSSSTVMMKALEDELARANADTSGKTEALHVMAQRLNLIEEAANRKDEEIAAWMSRNQTREEELDVTRAQVESMKWTVELKTAEVAHEAARTKGIQASLDAALREVDAAEESLISAQSEVKVLRDEIGVREEELELMAGRLKSAYENWRYRADILTSIKRRLTSAIDGVEEASPVKELADELLGLFSADAAREARMKIEEETRERSFRMVAAVRDRSNSTKWGVQTSPVGSGSMSLAPPMEGDLSRPPTPGGRARTSSRARGLPSPSTRPHRSSTVASTHDEVAADLLAAVKESKRSQLRMTNFNLEPRALREYIGALSKNNRISTLIMEACKKPDVVLSSLCEALKVNRAVRVLKLAGAGLSSKSGGFLAAVLSDNPVLEELDVSENKLGDAGVTALAEALASNTTLMSLNLSGNSMGEEGTKALAQALSINAGLTKLDLSGNDLGPAGAQALGESLSSNTGLRELSLWGMSGIGLGGIRALVTGLRGNSTITHLTLADVGVARGEAGDVCLLLADYLRDNRSLRRFDISGNGWSGTNLGSVLSAVSESNVRELVLWGNQVNESDLESLLGVESKLTVLSVRGTGVDLSGIGPLLGSNTTLEWFDVSGNAVGAAGGASLGSGLSDNGVLKTLIASGCDLGDEGTLALVSGIVSKGAASAVEVLDLELNSISDAGAKSVFETLNSANRLRVVKMGWNYIAVKGSRALGRWASSSDFEVQELHLDGNQLEAEGVRQVCVGLASSKIRVLGLGSNSLRRDGIRAVAELMRAHRGMEVLNLSSNGIGSEGARVVADVLKSNGALLELDLSGNAVRDAGAHVLAESLKLNTRLAGLGLRDNGISATGEDSLRGAVGRNPRVDISWVVAA